MGPAPAGPFFYKFSEYSVYNIIELVVLVEEKSV